jgi:hypothetical protein
MHPATYRLWQVCRRSLIDGALFPTRLLSLNSVKVGFATLIANLQRCRLIRQLRLVYKKAHRDAIGVAKEEQLKTKEVNWLEIDLTKQPKAERLYKRRFEKAAAKFRARKPLRFLRHHANKITIILLVIPYAITAIKDQIVAPMKETLPQYQPLMDQLVSDMHSLPDAKPHEARSDYVMDMTQQSDHLERALYVAGKLSDPNFHYVITYNKKKLELLTVNPGGELEPDEALRFKVYTMNGIGSVRSQLYTRKAETEDALKDWNDNVALLGVLFLLAAIAAQIIKEPAAKKAK